MQRLVAALIAAAFLCVELAASADSRTTYIIQTCPASRPTAFADSETWHASLVSSFSANILYNYNAALQGFAAGLTPLQAQALRQRYGVLSVRPQVVYHLHTTRTPQFLGLTAPPPRRSSAWSAGNQGKGIVIGLIDGGVWPESRSFDDAGIDPPPAGRWKGTCVGPNFTCNNKLIGARFFIKAFNEAQPDEAKGLLHSPRDVDGHGTHTASTAAGVPVAGVAINGYASGTATGMAPRAWLAAYKVCWGVRCFNADILAAVDAALADGVNVISISIGGGALDLYNDDTAIAALSAAERGVFVTFSAGNDGPTAWSVANLAPWLLTVTGSSIDRDFPAVLTLGDGTALVGPSFFNTTGAPAPAARFPLADATAVRVPGSNSSLAACCVNGTIDRALAAGKIVICETGEIADDEKGVVLRAAGAAGMVLVNEPDLGEYVDPEAHVLPALNLGYTDGKRVRSYATKAGGKATAGIRSVGTRTGVKPAPVVCAFCSRGPNSIVQQVLKPDITAPGISILAAYSEDPGSASPGVPVVAYQMMSGTSMACPHVAGIAALLQVAHQDWSPAALRSALVTTAATAGNDGHPILDGDRNTSATPLAMGAGHVDADAAMEPGLVYDAGPDDYLAFLCSLNYTDAQLSAVARRKLRCKSVNRGGVASPEDLNQPSFSVVFPNASVGSVSLTHRRTLTNVATAASEYVVAVSAPAGVNVTVVPSRLRFEGLGKKKSYAVTFTAPKPPKADVFGALWWSDGVHVVRSPIVASSWTTPPSTSFD